MMIIDRHTATRIAEAMNHWAGMDHRMEIITPDEVLKLSPIATHEPNGYVVYSYQWEEVTIMAWLRNNGDVLVKHICW